MFRRLNIQHSDFSILDYIQEHYRSHTMDRLIPWVTRFGDLGVFWLAFSSMLLLSEKLRRAGLVMIGAISGGFVAGNLILKNLIRRDRPCWIDPLEDMLVKIPKDYSFPSGHSIASFAGAGALLHYSKMLGIPAMVLANLIAFSRMYLYVHFPTDVIGGAALGTLSAKIVTAIADKKSAGKEKDDSKG
ncbi:MAG TPA: phosphatase PAP2 family protein [Ruminococcus sp.]|nr:phosphatase PAP2 family protein [Ruminococcus sp.]